MKYICTVCGEIYDESIEGIKFEDLPEDLGLGYVELIDIFEGGDRYASEILRYCMDMKKAREKGVNQT